MSEPSDTPPKVERLYERMLLERSGGERVELALSMFATARQLARAQMGPCDPPVARERLFLRLYGRDFSPSERARIAAAIRRGRAD
jgi:hypothetical protein